MKHRLFFAIVGAVFLLSMIWTIKPGLLSAQSTLRWSPARRIPGMAQDSETPYLVADQNKTVHAFNSQWVGNNLAVFYSQWTLAHGWTYPIDILLSPNRNQATVLGAFLDSKGMIHVIFFGGTEQSAEIYYSRAPAVNAAVAHAWTPPTMIGDFAGKLASGTLTGDDKGNLFVLYSGNRDGNGLYEAHSTDGGVTWSVPKAVFLTNSNNLWVFAIQSIMDSKGQLHSVWTVDNKAGNGEAIYYTRLDANHQNWLVPYALARVRPEGYEVDWANIVAYRGELFVIYDDDVRRAMRRSSDGGQTWTDVVRIFTLIGENGAPEFVVDSNTVLHLILAARIQSPEVHGAWYSTWDGQSWSEPDAIVSGPRSRQFDPSRPQVIIVQGNLILATWQQDPGPEMEPSLWYSYVTLNAPELPIVALPTSAVTPNFTPTSPTPSKVPEVIRTRLVTPTYTSPVSETAPSASESNPNIGIILAILPVVGLLALVIVRNLKT